MSTSDYNRGYADGKAAGDAAAREECLPFIGVRAPHGTQPWVVKYRTDLPPYRALTQYAADLAEAVKVAEHHAEQADAARLRAVEEEMQVLSSVEDLQTERKTKGGVTGLLAPVRRVFDEGKVSAARRETESSRDLYLRWSNQGWNLQNELHQVRHEIRRMIEHVNTYEAEQ